METTFYLKYRPQKFSDLDSTEAREELEKIFSSGKIPHAFLFIGPRGIGKTSAARIVAKAVNCERIYGLQSTDYGLRTTVDSGRKMGDGSKEYEPCNECSACKSITEGTNVDVLEIDAASNRGIEDIKELREKIKLAPANLRFKVYIIDEVHMLTTEAFNALLKTLEEPPKHAIFILCTTDPEKLPKTIVSRCVVINFKRATKKEILGRLEKICQKENIEFEPAGLEEIVKASEGSFRDANKILEQVSFEGKVTLEKVRKIIGLVSEFSLDEFLNLLKEKKVKDALEWVSRAYENGMNLKILTERVLDKLRSSLLACFGVQIEGEKEAKVDFTIEELKELIGLFSKAYGDLRTAVIPQLPLEMAIIEWGGKEEKPVGEEKISEDLPPVSPKKVIEKKESQEVRVEEKMVVKEKETSNLSLEEVKLKWGEVLEKVKPMNHSVLAFLKAAQPFACEEGCLVLEVFYKFHKDQLEKETSRRIFEKAASEVFGRQVKLKCRLGEGKREQKKEEVTNQPLSNEDSDIIEVAKKLFSG